jgi:hypothetical protein
MGVVAGAGHDDQHAGRAFFPTLGLVVAPIPGVLNPRQNLFFSTGPLNPFFNQETL